MVDLAKLDEQAVEAAAKEFLSHKGERPWRVTRRGAELWEDYAPAMSAAIAAYLKAIRESSERGR
jgi:hypothetical protein